MSRLGLATLPAPADAGAGAAPGFADEEPRRARPASTRNPWDDPRFEPGIRGLERRREHARVARLIALVDVTPVAPDDRDVCESCRRLTAHLTPLGICPACVRRIRLRRGSRRLR
jgi:hypothetical protein